MASRSRISCVRRVEIAALVVASIVVLVALHAGITHRGFDVDEIQHTHVMWRISVGDRPFHDFVETHPPFAWYLGAPLMRGLETPAQAVSVFRWIAALSGLAFVACLVASFAAGAKGVRPEWLLAAVLLVLSQPRNLDYLLEARPDSPVYAWFFLGIFLFLREWPARVFPRYAILAFVITTAVLSNPKLALLAALFGAVDLALRVRCQDALHAAIGGHATGIALALAVALLALLAAGIDPALAYELSIGFHRRFLAETTYSYGLARNVLEQQVPLAAAASGVAVWLGLVLWRRRSPARLEIALLGFLAVTLFTVPLPYKQYFAPWLLMAAMFAGYLGLGLERIGRRLAGAALLVVLATAAVGGWRAALAYGKADQVSRHQRMWEAMAGAAAPEGRVVAAPHMHPVFRRSVFYAWFKTFDPRGRDQAAIMREWDPDGLGRRFDRPGYVEDLARHPPALIVTIRDGFGLRGVQEAVMAEHLRAHREDYVRVSFPGVPDLLVRRDQANWEWIDSGGRVRE